MGRIRSILFFVVLYHYLPLYAQVPTEHIEWVDSVMINDSLANYYHSIGDDHNALIYASKNVGINQNCGDNSVLYAISKLKLARYLPDNEFDYNRELSTSSLEVLKDSLGITSSTYTKYMLEYAWRLFDNEDIEEAIRITDETVKSIKNHNEFLQN